VAISSDEGCKASAIVSVVGFSTSLPELAFPHAVNRKLKTTKTVIANKPIFQALL
jgi:hypothetical protein